MSNVTNIVESANELQANHTKLELVNMARAMGWRGDHARAPILQLALYVATKLASGERGQNFDGGRQSDQQASGQGQQSDQSPTPDQQASGQQASGQQSDQSPTPDQQASGQGQQSDDADGASKSDWEKWAEQQAEEMQQQQQQQQEQQEQEQEPLPPADQSNEFQQLLAASGISTPHVLLQKVWRLTAKAGLNVLLVGPAGTGKTMLAQQLGQLLRLPFQSVSCTMGMSESQLTGWLLPVGDNGRFDYVPSPFVNCMQQPSVFLLDELDAADPNVLMVANSVLSNGFLTIPHKLQAPTITRHEDAIIIAGSNTSGNGSDDVYTARAQLDGATIDRFYPIVVGYDEAYEHGLFALGKSRKRSSPWQPSATTVDQLVLDEARGWFQNLRKSATKAQLGKIISSRMAQRLVAALKAGIPVAEAKRDLLVGWSDDERARAGAGV